jgi:hypothetical protein
MAYQFNPDALPDASFHPGELNHKCAVQNFRRVGDAERGAPAGAQATPVARGLR